MINKIKRKISIIVDNKLPYYFVSNKFLSKLYYFLFSDKFQREHYSVLNGKVKHLKESKRNKSNLYTLIRNIHRLEKGLLMRPRRDVFAVDFIKETIDIFETLFNKDDCKDNSQIKWAHDVLKEYFAQTGEHIVINSARKRFNSLTVDLCLTNERKSIPYKRLVENKSNITFDEFFKLTKYRRSVRWFEDKPVPRELIDKAILAANQSPTACNRQPFEFRIVDDPELLKEVVNIPMGIKGYEKNIPVLVITVGNLDAYFDERDRHVIYIDASLANMTFMLALETLGLSSCSINWPDIEELEVRMEKALKLESHQRPIMCMAIGYPDADGMVAFSEKRSLKDIRKYN